LFNRQRKTKDPCPVCFLHRARCICEVIPCLNLKTRVVLIVHAKELKRTTNTGRLAVQALKNSELLVRGQGRERLDLSGLNRADYQSLFLFPDVGSHELTVDLIRSFTKPIQLIVPDGNWRQASKVYGRHPELSAIPRVKTTRPDDSQFHLRRESTREGMSTLQAIGMALSIIEGETASGPLEALYQAKLERTLEGRGVSRLKTGPA
jgi:DTW domain-containing protein YfiP